MATGNYIAIWGDDDVWREDFIATLIAPMEMDPAMVVAFCNHDIIDAKGESNGAATDRVARRVGRHFLHDGVYRSFDDIAAFISTPLMKCRYHSLQSARSLTNIHRSWRADLRWTLELWMMSLRDDRLKCRPYLKMLCASKAAVILVDGLQRDNVRGIGVDVSQFFRWGLLDPRVIYDHLLLLAFFRSSAWAASFRDRRVPGFDRSVCAGAYCEGMSMKTLEETRAYARNLAAGHLDAIGRPYHTHLDRVLAHLDRLFPGAEEAVRHGALLHSCVEEKRATLEELRAEGYPEETIQMVSWNTRPRGEDAPAYLDWIRNLAERAPVEAVMIKIADNEDNNDPQRIALLPEDQRDVSAVYAQARTILEDGLHRRGNPARAKR